MRTSQPPEELARLDQRVASDDVVNARVVGTRWWSDPRENDFHATDRRIMNLPAGCRGSLHRADARLESLEVGIALSTILVDTLQEKRGSPEGGPLVAWVDERACHAGQDRSESEMAM